MKRVAFTAWCNRRNPISALRWLWAEIGYFFQRGLYGVSDYDAWSLFVYIARVMANGLPALTHSTPTRYTDEEWAERLATLRDFFQLIADESDPDRGDDIAPEALRVFTEDYFDLWD